MTRLRSVLFAPATRPDVLAKLPRSGPDGAVIDLEDAVPVAQKGEARANVGPASLALADAGVSAFVRVNGLDSPWFDDDMAVLNPALTGVVVPKISRADDIHRVVDALDDHGLDDVAILAGIETVAGVLGAVSTLTHPRVTWCYFGAEDYVADLGGVRTSDNGEVAVPRAQVAQAARVGDVHALDQVVTDFTDDDRFAREAIQARSLGYRGKLCIHPRQVPHANDGFAPSPDEVAWASAVVAAYDEAVRRGEAAVQVDGEMVDEPVAQRARRILTDAE